MSVRTKIMQPNLLHDLLHDVDSTMCKQRKHRIMLKCQSTMYRLFIVLCWLWNIYEGAELLSVYSITNTKHCKTYLAMTQLFPVLLTHRPHIMKISILCSILLHFIKEYSDGRVQRGQMDLSAAFFFHSLQNNLGNISLITHYRCIC